MEHAYGSAGYSFQLQYFGLNLGYEVVSIDNISSQAGTDKFLFWEFSANGKVAGKGVDETSLKEGDKVGWNYTVYEPSTHGRDQAESV